MIYPFFNYIFASPLFVPTDNRPPTIYDILNSKLNFGKSKEEITKISELAKKGHQFIFDFDYPLSTYVSKDDFETMILNKFLTRRIGFDTVTAFKIQLNVKMNEIMPKFNKLFNSLENWDIFNDGEIIERNGLETTTNKTTNTLTNTSSTNTDSSDNKINDRRYSDTPQNKLENVQDGSYVTNYTYENNKNTNTTKSSDTSKSDGSGNSNTNNNYSETTKHSISNKIEVYKQMQNEIDSIYTLIFNELEELFYYFV